MNRQRRIASCSLLMSKRTMPVENEVLFAIAYRISSRRESTIQKLSITGGCSGGSTGASSPKWISALLCRELHHALFPVPSYRRDGISRNLTRDSLELCSILRARCSPLISQNSPNDSRIVRVRTSSTIPVESVLFFSEALFKISTTGARFIARVA